MSRTHGPLVGPDGWTTYRVWAPKAAASVEVVLGDGRLAMDHDGSGWWTLTASGRHGDDYAFAIDGGPARPDPASRWQPDGVHAHSKLLDPATFEWSAGEPSWRAPALSAGVVYELHIGTFTPVGTFDAAIPRLARLAELGVTHVEVMPVNAFNGTRGWGYDGVAWYAVHEPYGGPAAFARFVDACHRHGLAVVLDCVYNHLGPSGNYLPEFGPYLTKAYSTPWGDALNLDGEHSDPVRAFIVGNALQWFTDFHVDALRLDAVHGLVDQSATHILTELSAAVADLGARQGRPLQLIAESDRADPLTITARELGGNGLDAQWADDLHHAIHTAVTGEDDGYYVDYDGLADVVRTYQRGFLYDGRYSRYRRRTVGAPLRDISGHRLVVCIQNHDQVGNRATGDRLTTVVEPALARVAAALLCAAPMTPMLFMGEEYGETNPFQYFTSHPEPELAAAVRDGRREEFASFTSFGEEVPDPQDEATFRRSVLSWERADTVEGRQRLALWRDLLSLRRKVAALANGRRDLVEGMHETREVVVVARRDPAGGAAVIAVNLAGHDVDLCVPRVGGAPLELALSTDDVRYGGEGRAASIQPSGADLRVLLPTRTAAVWTG